MKIQRIKNSLGVVVLPEKEAPARLNLKNNGRLYVGETAEGALARTPSDPDFAAQMDAARKRMGRFRTALRELAK